MITGLFHFYTEETKLIELYKVLQILVPQSMKEELQSLVEHLLQKVVGLISQSAKVLMTGNSRGVSGREPVAWTHTSPGGGKVFYTSLGHPYDFGITGFRTMLRNAIYWSVDMKPGDASGGCCE